MKNSYLKKFMVVTLTAAMALVESPTVMVFAEGEDMVGSETAESGFESADNFDGREVQPSEYGVDAGGISGTVQEDSSESENIMDSEELGSEDDLSGEETFFADETFLEDDIDIFSTYEENEEFAFIDGEETEGVTAVQNSGMQQIAGDSMKVDLQEGENVFKFTPSVAGFYLFSKIQNDTAQENVNELSIDELIVEGNEIENIMEGEEYDPGYTAYYLRGDKTYTIVVSCEYKKNRDDYDPNDDYDPDDADDYDDDDYADDAYDQEVYNTDEYDYSSVGDGGAVNQSSGLSLSVKLKCAKTYPSNVTWAICKNAGSIQGQESEWSVYYAQDSSGVLTIEEGDKEPEISGIESCIVQEIYSDDYGAVKKIIIGEGIEGFWPSVSDFKNLTELQLPSSLKRLGEARGWFSYRYCLSNREKLKTITIPKENSLISAVNIPDTLYAKNYPNDNVMIGKVLIGYKGTAEKWKVPDGVIAIGDNAALDNEKLKEVTVPGSVTNIGYAAFAGDTALENVVIKEGVKTIEQEAFLGTFYLKEITIPKSVTDMSEAYIGYIATPDVYHYPDGIKYNEILPTINCYSGSVAYQYAKEHNLPYKLLDKTPTSLVGKTFTSGNYKYKITAKNTVTFTGLKKQKASTVKIGNTVKYKGKTYNITAIANKALYNNKYLRLPIPQMGFAP